MPKFIRDIIQGNASPYLITYHEEPSVNRAIGVSRAFPLPVLPLIADSEAAIPVITRPGESVDVFVQDQTTPAFDAYFFKTLGTTALAIDGSKNDTTVTLTAGHGAVAGNAFLLFTASAAFFASITNVNVNVITLDTPLSGDYSSGGSVILGERNLGVANGSLGSPISYAVELPIIDSVQLDITRIMITMTTDTPVSLAEFGDIAELTNGIVLRLIPATGDNIVYWNIKRNEQFALHAYDLTFWEATNPVQGTDGLAVRSTFGGASKRGVVVRLSAGDKLELLIQDDLTDIASFFVMAEGHVVLD
jgi:hypothetical protein